MARRLKEPGHQQTYGIDLNTIQWKIPLPAEEGSIHWDLNTMDAIVQIKFSNPFKNIWIVINGFHWSLFLKVLW